MSPALILFFTILAWCGVIISGGIFIVTAFCWWDYNFSSTSGLQQSIDRLNGYRKVYKPFRYLIICIICIAWIIAF